MDAAELSCDGLLMAGTCVAIRRENRFCTFPDSEEVRTDIGFLTDGPTLRSIEAMTPVAGACPAPGEARPLRDS